MELVWEDPQVPDAPFFTNELYVKYSLAPNIRELWDFLQSPVQNIKQDCGTSKCFLPLFFYKRRCSL
ncbi:hypothetical protein CgunFtcFv8_013120 [Champsocephalus gunnari]|uniref:Uncharacterized protein n=1 Tax=Champsocephalus gunnari TaxID=52237 RepID=A0AAN8DRY3_CHAGU|nr:hypothetical protein CgunFtcFv8_013120 [Champsocephalus gunnari]